VRSVGRVDVVVSPVMDVLLGGYPLVKGDQELVKVGGWAVGWMDGWMDEWMDGRMDFLGGQLHLLGFQRLTPTPPHPHPPPNAPPHPPTPQNNSSCASSGPLCWCPSSTLSWTRRAAWWR